MSPVLKNVIFFLSGIATTAISLGIVSAVLQATGDFNIMGFYLMFIIPIGAIFVGLLAAAGYGISARYLGVKLTASKTVGVVLLCLIAYMLVQYVEYQTVLASVLEKNPGLKLEMLKTLEQEALKNGVEAPIILSNFWGYFDYATRAFSFDGEGLGVLGYAFRVLEVGGFLGGAWFTASMAGSKPFCDECQVYYTERVIGYVPFMDDNDGQYVTHLDEAFSEESHPKLAGFIDDANFTADDPGLPNRLQLQQYCCPSCSEGWFQLNQVYVDHDNDTASAMIESWHTSTEFNKQFNQHI